MANTQDYYYYDDSMAYVTEECGTHEHTGLPRRDGYDAEHDDDDNDHDDGYGRTDGVHHYGRDTISDRFEYGLSAVQRVRRVRSGRLISNEDQSTDDLKLLVETVNEATDERATRTNALGEGCATTA